MVNLHDNPRWKAVPNLYHYIIYNYTQLGTTAKNDRVTYAKLGPNLSKKESENNVAIVLQRDSNTWRVFS